MGKGNETAVLLKMLKQYSASGALPMHMPGHKRNTDRFPWLAELGGNIDITEIEGFDNLNDPKTVFADLEAMIAKLWGADESICLVGGSTQGVLASLYSTLHRGGSLLLCRNAHKSLYHAAEIARADVHYIMPPADEYGIFGSIPPSAIEEALDAYPDVKVVAVTSPTYEGVISDINAISDVCRKHGAILFVDEAHGAHLGFGGFPASAVTTGADIVVESLHKTLPSLTQTAVLHMNGDSVDRGDIRRCASMFGTSSPSYILSASIDACVRFLEREGSNNANDWLSALASFRTQTKELSKLRIYSGGDSVYALDPSKIVVSTAYSDMKGAELAQTLRDEFSIEPEAVIGENVILMTGMGDTDDTLSRLASALTDIDAHCGLSEREQPCPQTLPQKSLNAWEAVTRHCEAVTLENAVGRVSAEYVWAYPPGIPLIIPGEVIDEDFLRAVSSETELHSMHGFLPKRIFVLNT